MDSIFNVKTYSNNKPLIKDWSNIKFVYTIEIYTEGRIWSDHTLDIWLKTGIKTSIYISMMKTKFDCIKHDYKLFFKTKKDCEEAIKFIESIQVANELLK